MAGIQKLLRKHKGVVFIFIFSFELLTSIVQTILGRKKTVAIK